MKQLRLDSRPARPLTSRECSKLICALLGVMSSRFNVGYRSQVEQLLGMLVRIIGGSVCAADEELDVDPSLLPSFKMVSGLSAAMADFSGPEPVITALRWLLESDKGQLCMEALFGSSTPGTQPPST